MLQLYIILICMLFNFYNSSSQLKVSGVFRSCDILYMSQAMRKPVYAICEQQRRRSVCASAQSDQHLCCRCLNSIIPLVSISKISSIYLASVAEQAGLSLTWSKTPKTGFLMTKLIYIHVYVVSLKSCLP